MNKITKTKQTLIFFVFAVALFSIERVALYFLNFSYFSSLNFEITILSFLQGIRIDIITILTSSFPFILALLYSNKFRKTISSIWFILIIFIFTVNLGDIGYFPFVHRHISNEVFLLANDLDFFIGIVGNYLFEIISYLIIIFGVFFVWKKIQEVEIKNYPISNIKYIIHIFLVVIIIVIGIRSKIIGKPFGLSDAFVNDNIASANLSLNGFYSIYRGKKRESYNFMDNNVAIEISRNILKTPNTEYISNDYPIQRKMIKSGDANKYNFVILVVESFTSKYVDSFGNEQFGVTPYFDKLAKESLSFPNFYANGQRSIEGITAILTGIPSITGLPNLGYGLELSKLSYLGQILKAEGYSTIGMRSAKKSSFRIGTTMKFSGFDEVYGAEDIKNYRKDERDVSLPFNSVWDGSMLRFMKEKIDNTKKPFLTFGFTASTHFPCKLANEKFEIYPHEEFGINGHLNNLKYFDSQLKEFIESSKKEDWFKNTIFIITADHTIGKGIGVEKKSLAHFRIPMIIYAPNIFEPQIIDDIGTQADILPTIIDILNIDSSFSTLSNSLFDKESTKFGIIREGNSMILLDSNMSFQRVEQSKSLKGVLQTFSNLVDKNRVFY